MSSETPAPLRRSLNAVVKSLASTSCGLQKLHFPSGWVERDLGRDQNIAQRHNATLQRSLGICSKKQVVTFVAIVLLMAVSSAVVSAAPGDMSSDFRKLEEQFQQAQSNAEFAGVANGYEALKEQNGTSVSVLFNQANAWFKAEELGRAIAGYRQALRLAPGDAAIRSNLKLAVKKGGHSLAQPTAVDYAFFWKDRITTSALAILITGLLLLAAALFLLNRKSSLGRLTLRILTTVTLILIASFALKVSEEQPAAHGVVVVDSSDARKGPATSYESAFSSPLTDGREFTVVRQQKGWVEVHINGIGSGWIPESDVLVY